MYSIYIYIHWHVHYIAYRWYRCSNWQTTKIIHIHSRQTCFYSKAKKHLLSNSCFSSIFPNPPSKFTLNMSEFFNPSKQHTAHFVHVVAAPKPKHLLLSGPNHWVLQGHRCPAASQQFSMTGCKAKEQRSKFQATKKYTSWVWPNPLPVGLWEMEV